MCLQSQLKDICRKILVYEYIYKVYLPFNHIETFLLDNGASFINKDWRNLARALSFKHIQSSPKNPRANGKIKNIHNFLKCTMKIIHGDKEIQWHDAIWSDCCTFSQHIPQCCKWILTIPTPFWQRRFQPTLEQTWSRKHSHTALWHYSISTWAAQTLEITCSWNSEKLIKEWQWKDYTRSATEDYHVHGLDPKFCGNWKVLKFNLDRQVVMENTIGDNRVLSTRNIKRATHTDVIFLTCDFRPSWKW